MVYATSLRWFSSHDEDELDKISNHHLRFCLLGFIPHTMVTMTMMIHASIINNDDGDTLSRHCIGGSSRRPMGGRAGWQAYNPWWLWCSMMVEDEDCEDRNNGWWWLLTRMVDGDKDWRWWCCWLLFQPGHGKGWPGKAKLKTASKLFQYPVFFFYFFLKVFVLAPDDVFFSGEFSHWCCQFAKDTFSVQPQNVFHWRRHLSLIKSKLHSGQCVQPVHLLKVWKSSDSIQCLKYKRGHDFMCWDVAYKVNM